MTTLKPYPSYNDSGVEWLGDVPEHWKIQRAKSVYRPIDIRSTTGEEELLSVSESEGVTPRSQKSVTMFMAESYVGHKLCWPDDLVINSLWAWKKGLGVSEYHGIVSSAYGVYRLRHPNTHYARYLHRALRSTTYDYELRVRSRGVWTSRLQLTDDAFFDMSLVLPPLDEQRAIADFLDGMDARITRFLSARRKMIALLEEQKQAVVKLAVTRGLESDVPLKDSGVDWVGEIPAHWDVRKVGALTSLIQTGPFGSQLPASEYMDDGVPLINPSHISVGRIVPDPKIAVSESTAERLGRHRFRSNDIVLARRGEMGRCAVVDMSSEGWLCGTGSLLVRPRIGMTLPRYLQLVLSNNALAAWLELTSAGATMSNLNTTMVATIGSPLPPIDEQQLIIDHIDVESFRIDKLICRHRHEINLIQEYRTRLISDVVTGKWDVRGVELPRLEAVEGSKNELAMGSALEAEGEEGL